MAKKAVNVVKKAAKKVTNVVKSAANSIVNVTKSTINSLFSTKNNNSSTLKNNYTSPSNNVFVRSEMIDKLTILEQQGFKLLNHYEIYLSKSIIEAVVKHCTTNKKAFEQTLDIPNIKNKGNNYTGALWMVDTSGALGQGHSAIVLLKENNDKEYYSFQAKSIFDKAEVKSGKKIPSRYTNGIYIPITNKQGENIHKKALEIKDNPGDYSLLTNNCNQNTQKILNAGGVQFAPSVFDGAFTRPNSVYDNIVHLIDSGVYQGWRYGCL